MYILDHEHRLDKTVFDDENAEAAVKIHQDEDRSWTSNSLYNLNNKYTM